MLSGVYHCQKRDRQLLKWSFKAKIKRSLKRYISELGPAKFFSAIVSEILLGR